MQLLLITDYQCLLMAIGSGLAQGRAWALARVVTIRHDDVTAASVMQSSLIILICLQITGYRQIRYRVGQSHVRD